MVGIIHVHGSMYYAGKVWDESFVHLDDSYIGGIAGTRVRYGASGSECVNRLVRNARGLVTSNH